MICSTHNVELGEGMQKKICGSCIVDFNNMMEESVKRTKEKQKIHWDSPLCHCDICKAISK